MVAGKVFSWKLRLISERYIRIKSAVFHKVDSIPLCPAGECNKHSSFVTNEGVSQMNMGQDKNIDEGLKCLSHLSEASTPTEAPTVFNHPEFGELRTVEIDGVVWFVGKDVAEALGYSKSRKCYCSSC